MGGGGGGGRGGVVKSRLKDSGQRQTHVTDGQTKSEERCGGGGGGGGGIQAPSTAL